jgi:hypothetical protein
MRTTEGYKPCLCVLCTKLRAIPGIELNQELEDSIAEFLNRQGLAGADGYALPLVLAHLIKLGHGPK